MSQRKTMEMGRRGFMLSVGAGLGALAAGRAVADVTPRESVPEPPRATFGVPVPAGTDAGPLFGGLAGTEIGRWTVVAVHGLYLGAVPVCLAGRDGARFQVDVLRRDPNGPRGVAETEGLSLFVVNRGDGRMTTDEEQGLGAMALAEALAAREARGLTAPLLLSHAERHRAHPGEILRVFA